MAYGLMDVIGMFFLPQKSHGSEERETSGNRFRWVLPESRLGAPAKGAAHAANVLKKS